MAQYDVISFLSDLGIDDESVGVCKAIMMQQAPDAHILDVTHQIKPFDVRAGALALTRAIQFLPSGVVLAAVDPGAPRDQRYIAVELENSIFVGPDNGILAPAAQLLGEPIRVHELSDPEYRIEAPGGVFAARDIMAPAAGVIASGVDISELGNAIPLEQLVPGMLKLSRHDEGGAFLGEVWSIDRFENIQTNITPEEMTATGLRIGDTVIVRIGENDFMAKFVERYADLQQSQLGLLVDSTGMLSIAKNLDFAARSLTVSEGSALAIMPQGATITGRDITVESVQAMTPPVPIEYEAPIQESAPVVSPLPQVIPATAQYVAPVEEAKDEDSPIAPVVPASLTQAPTFDPFPTDGYVPVPTSQAAPAPSPAPAQFENPEPIAMPQTTPIQFEAPVAPPVQGEQIIEAASLQYETHPVAPLEYDVPTPMPDPVFEPTQNSGSVAPGPLRTEPVNPFEQNTQMAPAPVRYDAPVPPVAPTPNSFRYDAPVATPAPAPIQFDAPIPQAAPAPISFEVPTAPPDLQTQDAQNVFASPTFVPSEPSVPAENIFTDQYGQPAPAPAAPIADEPPVVQPQTYVQEPVAPIQSVAPTPVVDPQIQMPPQPAPAPYAPAPAPYAPAPAPYAPAPQPAPAPYAPAPAAAPQAQGHTPAPAPSSDQIPSGNVFDLFKIDAENVNESEDPFNPAQQ